MTNDHYNTNEIKVKEELKIIKHCFVPLTLTHLAHVFGITLSLTKTLLYLKLFVFSLTTVDIFISTLNDGFTPVYHNT